jgi:TolB-like protein/Tfp pilus assembly protein PilF
MSCIRSDEAGRQRDLRVSERLDSWKEIAAYLKRSLRTVQLWEEQESLPIHRLPHKALASVYAHKAELDAWWVGRQPRPSTKQSLLAILPFENLSGDAKVQCLTDSFVNDTVSRITNLVSPHISVMSRRATLGLKHSAESLDRAAEKLGIAYLMEGQVYQTGDSVVICVQLIKATDQTHMWGESYEMNCLGPLVPRRKVADQIAQAVAQRLAPVENQPPLPAKISGTEAHRAYLMGRFYWNHRTAEGLTKAIGYFQQALQANPNCALGYSGLADCYVQLGFYGILPATTAMKQARLSALKAVELDETLAEAHASLADVMTYFDWDFVGAEREYLQAIHLNPDYPTGYHWYADYLAIVGRFGDALANGELALGLDPVSPAINVWLGMKHYLAGQYDEAMERHRKTLEMHPNYCLAHWALGLAYEQKDKFEEAIKEKQKAVTLSGDTSWMTAGLGYSYALSGKRKQAQTILARLIGPPERTSSLSYEIAAIYAALGNEDQALQWLQRAWDDHSAWAPYMKVEPRLKCLHGNPKFLQLANRFQIGGSDGTSDSRIHNRGKILPGQISIKDRRLSV